MRCSPAGRLHDWFIGEDQLAFWAGAIHSGPDSHILVDIEHVPLFIAWLPTITSALGVLLAYVMYMLRPDLPGRLATVFQPVLPVPACTNGISTSFTISYSYARRSAWPACSGMSAMSG